jgi:uncharacterized protein (TIGR02646 family)
MQGQRCAYCEGDLNSLGQHIEHFRQRDRHPRLTFEWHNLFWSCDREDSCGTYKDNSATHNENDLLKPDEDDPEEYFLFVSDGTIAVRSGLNAVQKRRAEVTLRAFNLDQQWGRLRMMRQSAAAGYIKTAEEIREFAAQVEPEVWRPFLEEELRNIQDLPFCTTIKHVLSPR